VVAGDGCDASCQDEVSESQDAGVPTAGGAGASAGAPALDGAVAPPSGGNAAVDSGAAGRSVGGRHSSVSPDETDENEPAEHDEMAVRGACGCRSVGTALPQAPHGLLVALILLQLRRRRGHRCRSVGA
jgi:hypothetical protein